MWSGDDLGYTATILKCPHPAFNPEPEATVVVVSDSLRRGRRLRLGVKRGHRQPASAHNNRLEGNKPMKAAYSVAFFLVFACLATNVSPSSLAAGEAQNERPNILFAIADDWGWPHAGAYGDPAVKTPAFDRLGREGVLFRHAYVSSPSCTPSRGAVLTGQWHWRLEGAGNLWSVFPNKFSTYPEILKEAGYEVGVSSKGWGPGRTERPGRELGTRTPPACG